MIRLAVTALRVAAIAAAFGLVLLALQAGEPTPRKRGGTLRLLTPQEFATLDPLASQNTDYWAYQRFIFRGLLEYDDHDQLVVEQAQDWSLSPDKRTYTFHLRPDVRFPSGRAVEAADYVFSLERVLDPKNGSSGQSYLTNIRGADDFVKGTAPHVAGLRAPDKRTLVIELSAPSVVFFYKLAMPFTFPLPREEVARSEQAFRQHLTGTGPYQVQEHLPGVRWRLARNPQYHGSDGYPDEVEVSIVPDYYLQTMMVERGDADLSQLNAQDLLRLERNEKTSSLVHKISFADVDYVFMNTELKPFDDVRVRQAVCLALHRDRLARLAPPSLAATSIVGSVVGWTNPLIQPYRYDPQASRALLREAGLPDGFTTDCWYIQEYLGRVPEAVQEQLRLVGIKAQLHPVTATALYEKACSRRQTPMGIWGWLVDYPDPVSFFDPPLNGVKITERDCYNSAFYNNSELNALITQADLTFEKHERLTLLQRMESIAMRDFPWAPLVYERRAYLCRPRLRGFQGHPVWMYRLEKLWLDRD